MVHVHVWNERQRRTGHAALTVDPDLYISYWPAKEGPQAEATGRVRKTGKKATLRVSGATISDDLPEDIEHLRSEPNHEVVIKGLDEEAIRTFWEEVLTGENKRFHLLDHNCSTVVAGALQEGYDESIGTTFASVWKLARWYKPANLTAIALANLSTGTIWYPTQVLRFATAIKHVTD